MKKIGSSLNEMINKLLLIFGIYLTILKKQKMHINQSIT